MSCPFCSVDASRIAFSNDLVIAIWDGFPVSPGHLLIIPRRHVPNWPDLSAAEKSTIWSAIDQGQAVDLRTVPSGRFQCRFQRKSGSRSNGLPLPSAYYPALCGRRYRSPRQVFDTSFLTKPTTLRRVQFSETTNQRLVTGGDDPLLPHLLLNLDRSTTCDMAVAFLLDSGARMIVSHLRDFLARGGRARILVGDYLEVTEPSALRRLNDLSGELQVRVYEARDRGFHLKTYIFQTDTRRCRLCRQFESVRARADQFHRMELQGYLSPGASWLCGNHERASKISSTRHHRFAQMRHGYAVTRRVACIRIGRQQK